jgi:hypothetical protein
MDRLLSFLPAGAKQPPEAAEGPCAEDLEVQ